MCVCASPSKSRGSTCPRSQAVFCKTKSCHVAKLCESHWTQTVGVIGLQSPPEKAVRPVLCASARPRSSDKLASSNCSGDLETVLTSVENRQLESHQKRAFHETSAFSLAPHAVPPPSPRTILSLWPFQCISLMFTGMGQTVLLSVCLLAVRLSVTAC